MTATDQGLEFFFAVEGDAHFRRAIGESQRWNLVAGPSASGGHAPPFADGFPPCRWPPEWFAPGGAETYDLWYTAGPVGDWSCMKSQPGSGLFFIGGGTPSLRSLW